MSDTKADGHRVVLAPERPHSCSPGWERYELASDDHIRDDIGATHGFRSVGYEFGTVIECSCGTTWVCFDKDPRVHGLVSLDARNGWRREGRLARWRRERKAARRDCGIDCTPRHLRQQEPHSLSGT